MRSEMSKRHEYVFMRGADLVRICNMSSNIVEDVRKRQPHEVIVLLVLGGMCYLTTKVGMTQGRSEGGLCEKSAEGERFEAGIG